MEDKQIPEYNPVVCEHKLPNSMTAWSFQSELSSNIGGPNKVIVHVCMLCGEISIGGFRPSKDEKHVNRFHEEFNIYHPDAIDAIIKQANFYNEEAKWGRIEASESAAASAVWVKASERLPLHKAFFNIPDGYKKDCYFPVRIDGNKYWMAEIFDEALKDDPEPKYSITVKSNGIEEYFSDQWHRIEWLDESGAAAQSLPPDVIDKILKARDALIADNRMEAYHQLYAIASPLFDKLKPWEEFEAARSTAAGSGKEEAVDKNLAFIAAVTEEGAEAWKMEYDACRSILRELVDLKNIKDLEGKTDDYNLRQPVAWVRAKRFLERYQHISL